ncbi:hypothetical protein RhiirC2_851220 [Rhizophagus irregularis]|uniref:Uncharacterized protein n=1 Tax=Rhizophagus irregularis TaxID=588596 RepID=A0A2N1N4C4_9GLOM|nr:hypothetical protein RhiirC2_851220 [Rhizophagus irregularis]
MWKGFCNSTKLRGHQNRKFLCKPTANPQDPTPEIVQLQPQLEQLQELIPEVIPAPAEKTPNLSIDELAKWLVGPGDYNQYTPRKRRAPQTDNEWHLQIRRALGAYFAYKDGHTQKLERIFQAEKFKPYLKQVNLNAILMPTPVCLYIFSKIEDLNPEISINEWCFGLGEAPQRVELPVKDFEADNRKCNENYGGNMHKIMEQKTNSFCYMVHWIETDKTWGSFLYRGQNPE